MRGLVMSGGGVKGAFQCGVLQELIERGTDWDYVAGTSVGALNASIIGQAGHNDLEDYGKQLLRLWQEVGGNKDVWKHWFLLRQAAGIWKDSLYNAKPLLEMIEKHVDADVLRNAPRKVRFGVTGYGSGEYREVSPCSVPAEEIHRWIAASAAFPGFLTPYELDGDLWVDGGVRRIAPLKGALDAGCTEVDVILTAPLTTTEQDITDSWTGMKRNALTILLRSVGLMSDEIFLRDVKMCQVVNHLVETGHESARGKRHVTMRVFAPKEHLLTGAAESLQFDPEKILSMILEGEGRARELLK